MLLTHCESCIVGARSVRQNLSTEFILKSVPNIQPRWLSGIMSSKFKPLILTVDRIPLEALLYGNRYYPHSLRMEDDNKIRSIKHNLLVIRSSTYSVLISKCLRH